VTKAVEVDGKIKPCVLNQKCSKTSYVCSSKLQPVPKPRLSGKLKNLGS